MFGNGLDMMGTQQWGGGGGGFGGGLDPSMLQSLFGGMDGPTQTQGFGASGSVGSGGGGYGAGTNNLYMSPYAGKTTDQGAAPVMPMFNSLYDPNSMSLGQDMSNMLKAGPQYDTQPLQQLKANAESTQQSPWAGLETQLNNSKTNQAASTMKGQTAGQEAQAEGNLAMSGGLTSGARERLNDSGTQAGIAAQQGIQNQGNQGNLQIGISDAANKQQQMMALPGMETQAYQAGLEPIQMQGQAQAQDIAHSMANDQALNQFNMAAYGNQASMYGAGQTAAAQEQTAQNTGGLFGGGGWLGLGI